MRVPVATRQHDSDRSHHQFTNLEPALMVLLKGRRAITSDLEHLRSDS